MMLPATEPVTDEPTTPTTPVASSLSAPVRSRGAFLFVTGTRVALVGSWFLATRTLANGLGPAGFGLYFPALTAIRVLTGCVGDPLDMAVMREAPLLLRSNRPRALELIRSAFWLRVGIAVVLLALAALLPTLTSQAIFASPDLRGLAVLAIAGVLGDFLLRSALGFFQVSQQFNRFLAVDAVWQLSRVVAVIILASLHKLTASAGIALYVIAPYVSFLVAWPMLPRDVRRVSPPHNEQLFRIVKYSGWVVAALVLAAACDRLDVLMLLRFRGKADVGIYGGAVLLASIPDFLDGIIQTVLAPRIAPAFADGTFNRLQRDYLKYAVPFGLLVGAAAMLLSRWGVHAFFSPAYMDCIPAFRILLASTIFNLVFTPLSSALVSYVRPKRAMLCTGAGLIAVTVGSLLFIPRYGAIGAAITMLFARVLVGVLTMFQAHRLTNCQPSAVDCSK